MSSSPQRLFSGMKPTNASLHLGNYLGALVNWVALQDQYDAIYSVVDLHATTIEIHPDDLRRDTRATAAQYLAAGINPDNVTLFVQSHVPAHSQLGWLLTCLTGHGEASRMTQFKDKLAKGEQSIGAGLYAYPMLMAADVLLYDTHVVPVGEDQRQHLELTRNLAQRVNARFGENTLVVPEPYIMQGSSKIQDLQDPSRKMSKSDNSAGLVELLDPPKQIRKRIMSAVTDAEREIRYDVANKPGVSNLLVIHSAFSGTPIPELEAQFAGAGYGDLKKSVAEVALDTIEPFQQRYRDLMDDPAELDRILAAGATRAKEIAEPVLERVQQAMGFLPPAGQA